MPSTSSAAITAQTRQLIADLRQIAEESSNAATNLKNIAPVIDSLKNINLNNIEGAITTMAQLNKVILDMSKDKTIIASLQEEITKLGKAYATFNAEKIARTTKGAETKLENKVGMNVPGFKRTAEQRLDISTNKENLNKLKEEAQYARKVVEYADKLWDDIQRESEGIWDKQGRVWHGFAMANQGVWYKPKTEEELKPEDLISEKEKEQGWSKFNTENAGRVFGELGLSDAAIKNLTRQLDEYGVAVGGVKKPVTELSSGITTLQMKAVGLDGVMQTFTAHIDRNGNVLDDTQKRYRTFGSAVVRDTIEVLKWTIAVSAIYGPIRKVGQMLEEAKKVQLDLVDVQIVLGNATNNLGDAFEAAAKIATQTSSSIEGVIAGYSQAASASASVRNESERMITTESLLKDSMILSKLANVDQKQALDTLVGAISQLGMNLSQGTQLLDSWVAVSKKANVSVKDMATSFAIVGSAAEEAGLSYNELNALVGTLAQNTTLSSDELGNAIRGIIAAMQTDKAQAEFAKYGIATKTVSGDFRDLMDILRQLKVMQQTGILDEKAMGALMQAGGAGARRGAQLSAIVKNLPQAMDLITVSQQANGDAAQAMALEMATLDAATTRLNNAFTSLAVTLGGEGGILSFLTAATNGFSGVVTVVRTLVNVLKGAAPVFGVLAFANAAIGTKQGNALTSKAIPSFLQNLLTAPGLGGYNPYTRQAVEGVPVAKNAPITNWLARLLQGTNVGVIPTTYAGQGYRGQTVRTTWQGQGRTPASMEPISPYYRTTTYGELGQTIYGKMQAPMFPNAGIFSKMNVLSLLGPAVMALSNIGQPNAGQRALAGGVGALPGILAGNPIWSTIGSVIATGFYDKFLTFKEDLATAWSEAAARAREDAGKEPGQAAVDRAMESMGMMEKFGINLQNLVLNAGSVVGEFMPKWVGGGWGGKQLGQSETALGMALAGGKNILGVRVMDEKTAQAIVDAYNAWLVEQANKGLITGVEIPQTPIESAVTTQIQGLAEFAATASADMMEQALQDIADNVSGSIGSYTTAMQAAKSLASTAGNLVTAQQGATWTNPQTKQTEQIIAPIGGPQMTPQEAVQFVSGLTDEQLQMLTASLTEYIGGLESLKTLKEQIAKEPEGIATDTQIEQMQKLNDQIETAKKNLPGYIAAFQQANLSTQAAEKVKPLIEVPEGLTAQQRGEIISKAEEMWREYLKLSGLTEEEIDAYVKAQQEMLIAANGEIFGTTTRVPQEWISKALPTMGFPTTQNFNLQDYRSQGITTSQWPQIMAKYANILRQIQNAFPAFQPDLQWMGIILKDGFTTEHIDNSILQMAMQDLIDVTKENGLQGIYNLPEGATFMIPVQGFELDQQTRSEIANGIGNAAADTFPTAEAKPNLMEANQRRQEMVARNIAIEERERARAAATSGLESISPANPLPVTVTNMPTGTLGLENWNPIPMPTGTLGLENWDPYKQQTTVGTTEATSPLPTWLQWIEDIGPTLGKLNDTISNLFSGFNTSTDMGVPNTNMQTEQPPVTTALNLEVDSSIILTVDGRQLATIIKPFFYEDMIRFIASAPSTINRSIVA